MGRLMTIDPGEHTGYACFENEKLIEAGIMSKGFGEIRYDLKVMFMRQKFVPEHAVIERPQIYPQRRWKGDPNDLIQVALIAGMCGGVLGEHCEIQFVFPRQWKGTRPKEVDNRYTLKLLEKDEQEILAKLGLPKYKLHNVIDAIGIGLWKLGRR